MLHIDELADMYIGYELMIIIVFIYLRVILV